MGKYIVITPFFPTPDSFRGPFVYDQVKAITGLRDYEVIVFKPTSLRSKARSYEYNGIQVHLFPMIQMPSYIFNGILNKLNQILFMRTVKRIGIAIDDIIAAHAHTGPFGTFTLALKKKNESIKTILQHHDPDPYTVRNGLFAGNFINLWIRAKSSIRLFSKIDIHVCVSQYVKRNLISFPVNNNEFFNSYKQRLVKAAKLGLNAPDFKRVEVLYNGVDVSKFKILDVRKESNKFIIGCIANFIDWKDQLTLLKAVRLLIEKEKITDIELRLVGSGPVLNECKQYVSDFNIEKYVEFLSEVDHSELPKFMNTFDLFVLPSYFEGFGCVFTEAAACGVPFICCKGQGASEYLDPDSEQQWTIAPNDYKSLSRMILRQINTPIKQRYQHPIEINSLVSDFLNKIDL